MHAYSCCLVENLKTSLNLVSVEQTDVEFLLMKVDSQLNDSQKVAIQMALKQPFTVISGGAGTGKTTTVVSLARLFNERNRMVPHSERNQAAHSQLLICGPSEKSLDLIAGMGRFYIPVLKYFLSITDSV